MKIGGSSSRKPMKSASAGKAEAAKTEAQERKPADAGKTVEKQAAQGLSGLTKDEVVKGPADVSRQPGSRLEGLADGPPEPVRPGMPPGPDGMKPLHGDHRKDRPPVAPEVRDEEAPPPPPPPPPPEDPTSVAQRSLRAGGPASGLAHQAPPGTHPGGPTGDEDGPQYPGEPMVPERPEGVKPRPEPDSVMSPPIGPDGPEPGPIGPTASPGEAARAEGADHGDSAVERRHDLEDLEPDEPPRPEV